MLSWTPPTVGGGRRASSSTRTTPPKFPQGGEEERESGASRQPVPGGEVAMLSLSKSWLLLTGFVLFYVIYLLLGALVFSSIERPEEEKLRRDVELLKQGFLNQSCVSAAGLDLFLEKVLRAHKRGLSVLRNSSRASNWDLASSMFFANTLVTTVGYGHIVPLTNGGKIFSIVYALIGVPFTMLVLTACVQRLMYPLVYVPVSLLHRSGLEPRPATVVHFTLLLLVLVLCFFLAPAAIFSILERSWSFLDGVYFCFISLCTIGLGDFVPTIQPGQRFKALYQVGVMVYLFTGLMMMYLLLRTFHMLADLHGLTTYLQLPRCDDSDQDEEHTPIMEAQKPDLSAEKSASRPLDPGSQPTYNTINKG
ncbi:potassium channel subfamily K member 6 [Synchiropus splendidus]|uniref:potassium channel subfamily K member 6 n=1 Tax=Synchiropus splendidus TaxID=270530 RepID=UPI00237ED0DB|nr:potassium channel subfamily K member 6 [Synchiropus splendidus]